MKLSTRDEAILYSLDKLGYATTSQLRTIHSLGSIRNAQRIMKRLSPYVNTRRIGEYVFYLSKKGRELIGSSKIRKATMQLEHAILRTQAYIHVNMPLVWKIEEPIRVNGEVFIIPDVTFAYDEYGIRYFVEIDCHQHMKNNYKKMDKYKELEEIAKRSGSSIPSILWYTRSNHRRKKLIMGLENRNMNARVFSLDDLH